MEETDIKGKLTRRISNPEIAAALFLLELLETNRIVFVAQRLLESAYDSPSLRILAGESAPTASDWIPIFKKAMAELKVQIPPRCEAAKMVAREIAKMIIEQEFAPQEGAQAMWDTLFLNKDISPQITIFSELAWALDSGTDPKPFPELSREQVERRIVDEARRIATIDGNTVSQTQ